MNETIRSILERRTCRRFKAEQIPQDKLDLIIAAGLHAPSGMNQQTWDFTVLRSKEKISALNEASKQAMAAKNYPNQREDIFYGAPVVVIVSLQKDGILPMADCSAAIQNMLLAAHSLSIGSCWNGGVITYFTEGDRAAEFGIPETHNPFFAVALGYPDGGIGKMPLRKEGTIRYID